MSKYDLLPEQLLYEGTVNPDAFFHPDPLEDDKILLTHTTEYLHKLNHQTLSPKEIRQIGFPMSPRLVYRGKHIANGTYMAALYAQEFGISMNIAGGTHHAFAHKGEGFCLFNDIAIASSILLKNTPFMKILIVDLDVHQGNGTASIFQNEERVFTFSMHGEKNYPLRKETSDLDIALPDGCDDNHYLKILDKHLNETISRVEPDFMFYLAGVDVLHTDKLGRLALTRQGCKERDRHVLTAAKNNKIPLAVSMGGGYSVHLRDIIEAHANTFRLAQNIFF
jgi:acetoin utilization deacetylase AcuC-like enzyme